MSTVDANASTANICQNTGREGRETGTQITCSECGRRNDCDCLDTTRILDLLVPLARQLVEMLAEGAGFEYAFLERIELLLDRNDQRLREWDAWPELGDAEDNKCDRVIVEDLVGPWGYTPSFSRTVEGVAELRKVPVERVRALLDRFLADSRESEPPACSPRTSDRPFSCGCSGSAHGKLTGCSGVATAGAVCDWCSAHNCSTLSASTQTLSPSPETWPTWAREVAAAVERRAA